MSCDNDKKVFYKDYYLAAGECNPQGEMPLTLLMTRIIEVATFHANSWGAGYARLIQDNQVWVLSRVTIEMKAYPKVDTNYRLTTWIEDYNRHFSQRNMRLDDADGNPLGYVRTIWMVIDMNTFGYMDCDFNRHVNTVRYLSHLMNLFDMDCYDQFFIQRMEISFIKETHYGETAQVVIDDADAMITNMSITIEGDDHVRARFHWKERHL